MKVKALVPLIVGLGIGLVAVKMGFDTIQKSKAASAERATVTAVRTVRDVPAYVELTPDMLETVETEPNIFLPKAEFFEKTEDVLGRVTGKPIPAGGPVLKSLLAPEGTSPGVEGMIEPGYRAVSVEIDEVTGVAYQLKPGNWVDVIVVMDISKGGRRSDTVAEVILQRVKVLAIGQTSPSAEVDEKSRKKARPAKSATLLVSEKDVPKLHLAATRGTLTLSMCGEGKEETEHSYFAKDSELLASQAPTRTQRPVDDSAKKGTSLIARFFGKGDPQEQPAAANPMPEPVQMEPVAVAPRTGTAGGRAAAAPSGRGLSRRGQRQHQRRTRDLSERSFTNRGRCEQGPRRRPGERPDGGSGQRREGPGDEAADRATGRGHYEAGHEGNREQRQRGTSGDRVMASRVKDDNQGTERRRLLPDRRRFVVSAALFVLLASAPDGRAAPPDIGDADSFVVSVDDMSAHYQRIEVPLNRSVVVKTAMATQQINVVAEHIADVQVISPTEFLVTGRSYGTTNILLFGAGEDQYTLEVVVELDLKLLNEALREIDPLSTVEAKSVLGNVVLAGTVSGAEQAERMVELAKLFVPSGAAGGGAQVRNHLDIAGEQQVLLRCVVAEVNRTATRPARHQRLPGGRELPRYVPGQPVGRHQCGQYRSRSRRFGRRADSVPDRSGRHPQHLGSDADDGLPARADGAVHQGDGG